MTDNPTNYFTTLNTEASDEQRRAWALSHLATLHYKPRLSGELIASVHPAAPVIMAHQSVEKRRVEDFDARMLAELAISLSEALDRVSLDYQKYVEMSPPHPMVIP